MTTFKVVSDGQIFIHVSPTGESIDVIRARFPGYTVTQLSPAPYANTWVYA